MFDYIGAFAGSVTDEEAWALFQVFGEAGFVYDYWGCFGDLGAVFEHGSVDFHAAGVDHRDYEAGFLGQVGDDVGGVGDLSCLRNECVECADCKEGLAGAEAEAFGCGYSHTEACV